MIPPPWLRPGSPRSPTGAGVQPRAPTGCPTAGSGSSERAWDFFWGIFPGLGVFTGAQPLCRQRAQDAARAWAALRHGALLLAFAGASLKSCVGGWVLLVFFILFWFCTAFSLLRCWQGVLGITERVFIQLQRRWLCGGVRRCPHGRRGREGPRDGIAAFLLPRPGKGAASSCQHRPLGKRADACVLLHVGVRASLPPCSELG